jgi:ferredoxin-NADP reductase
MPTPDHQEIELQLEVRARREIADGVLELTLGHPDDSPLPEWAAGAHIDLLLRHDLVRQYSLCGDPADRSCWRIAILREQPGRGGSRFVHETLREAEKVHVRGPRNNFSLLPSRRYLFVAGGIGITPLLPMLATADAAGAEWELLYGGRTRASMAFGADLVAAYGDRVTLSPQDENGMLDLDAWLDPAERDTTDTLVYCCGPEPLLEAVEERCSSWPAGALHLERFAPKEQGDPVRSDGFDVELSQSGMTLAVPPDKSILEVVEDAGVPVLSSCTAGTCGTCETAVVAGTPDHRDSLLSQEERDAADTMMICVSRSCTPTLVLDL